MATPAKGKETEPIADMVQVMHVDRSHNPHVVWARSLRNETVGRWIDEKHLSSEDAVTILDAIRKSAGTRRDQLISGLHLLSGARLLLAETTEPPELVKPHLAEGQEQPTEEEAVKAKIRNADVYIDGNKPVTGIDGNISTATEVLEEGHWVEIRETPDGDLSLTVMKDGEGGVSSIPA